MILSAEWQIVATTRSANSAWAWRLGDEDMRAFQKANLAGLVDVSVIGYSDGFRVMRARDKQAAAARLAKHGAGEPEPAAETPRKFPIAHLPPAKPCAGQTWALPTTRKPASASALSPAGMGDGLLVRVTTGIDQGGDPVIAVWLVATTTPQAAIAIVREVNPAIKVEISKRPVQPGMIKRLGLEPGEARKL